MPDTTNTNHKKIAVLSDFDGTIVPFNCVNALFDRFGDPLCKELEERWMRGEISVEDEFRQGFATISATREEMEEFLESVPVDPTFPAFLEYCRVQDIPFAIVSDGLRWSIEHIFARHGIRGVKIYACEIAFTPQGLQFAYPYFDPITPLGGTSKLALVRKYQRENYRVVFIGDGNNDSHPARAADLVYARDHLLMFTSTNNIPAIGFNSFDEILEHFASLTKVSS